VPQGNAVSVPERIKTIPQKSKTVFSIEDASPVQLKYAILMNREVESMANLPLYGCIDDWWGTRYRYGGNSRKGIDCSAFTGKIFEAVHGLCLPRTAREQYMACARISQDQLQEGDLVFFNTRGGISHVGVYLGDQYFVHASTTRGVVISRLDEDYYRARFMGAGRLETNSVAESQPAEEAE
jgi:lipoprotein Spr